jgi:hypothetical protein
LSGALLLVPLEIRRHQIRAIAGALSSVERASWRWARVRRVKRSMSDVAISDWAAVEELHLEVALAGNGDVREGRGRLA